MEKPEILAPAGSMEALRAAVSAGADAVYIGGSGFGARAYADNPDTEAMLEAIEYVHLRGKRLYLTVNTLVKEQEFGALYQFLAPYYAAGLDAAIVQDVGVLRFLAKEFLGLSLHASTQMTLTGTKGLDVFSGYPVTRLVPARELSLEEIADICKNSGKEVEIFVHGALCYCYSGQCLMSSLIGGRSGNRGRCAQPCRMEYESAENGKKYWLSPKDLCGLTLLPELIETGAASFKIEGRMKRPEYAAAVTAAYRKFTDLYFELGAKAYRKYVKDHPQLLSEEVERLSDVYNRGGFTTGCFLQHNGAELMSVNRPNHFGVPVGEVVAGGKGEAKIKLKKTVNAQDVLELRRESVKEQGVSGYYEYTLGSGAAAGTELKARLLPTLSARPGDKVYRMKNTALLKELEDAYVSKEKKQTVQGSFYAKAGEVCTLRVWTECEGTLPAVAFPKLDPVEVSVFCEGFVCEKAGKLPASEEAVAKQLRKTGNEPFSFGELEIVLADDVFLPNGLLNELRRKALAELAQEITAQYVRSGAVCGEGQTENLASEVPAATAKGQPYLDCVVSTKEQAEAAAKEEKVRRIYLDLAEVWKTEALCDLAEGLRKAGKEAWFVFPRISRKKTLERIKTECMALLEAFDGYLVRNYETLSLVAEFDPQWKERTCLDYNLYVMNREAKAFYGELFGKREGLVTAPQELSAKELKELGVSDMTLVVYGKVPLMVSAHCVKKTMGQCRGEQGQTEEPVCFTDRVGKVLSVKQYCKDCYNVIYNPECLSLSEKDLEAAELRPWALRADFTLETAEETARVLQSLSGKGAPLGGPGYTRGHFKRGVE